VTSNYTLKELDLGDNRLSTDCGLALVDAIQENPSFTSIALERNGLDHRAVCAVADILRGDTRFRVVRLRGNHVSSY
jgi:hypothetical protein